MAERSPLRSWLALVLLAILHTGCLRQRAAIPPLAAWGEAVPLPLDLATCRIAAGEWRAQRGALVAIAGPGNRAILLAPRGRGPVRVDAIVSIDTAPGETTVGDLSVLLGSDGSQALYRRGYMATSGSYWNHCTTIYRAGQPLARTEWSPLVPGHRYQVTVELADGRIRYWLDGVLLLEGAGPPLTEDDGWIGLRTWNSRLTIHAVAIRRAAFR